MSGRAAVRIEVHYCGEVTTITLDKKEVDEWIEDKVAFAGRRLSRTNADVIASHIKLNMQDEGVYAS